MTTASGKTQHTANGWITTKSGVLMSGLNPRFCAEEFWAMDSAQQTEFFAHLERIAGVDLCFQMAYVVDEIVSRADKGDRDAQNGFQTMLAHAQDYVQRATMIRTGAARMAIAAATTGEAP